MSRRLAPVTVAAVLTVTAWALALSGPIAATARADGIQNIQHVIVIMQENRSFDEYFGTYPGANGIPAGVCVPDKEGGCVAPYHDTADRSNGGAHGSAAIKQDIDGGKMDGFIFTHPKLPDNDVMGYHDAREI